MPQSSISRKKSGAKSKRVKAGATTTRFPGDRPASTTMVDHATHEPYIGAYLKTPLGVAIKVQSAELPPQEERYHRYKYGGSQSSSCTRNETR